MNDGLKLLYFLVFCSLEIGRFSFLSLSEGRSIRFCEGGGVGWKNIFMQLFFLAMLFIIFRRANYFFSPVFNRAISSLVFTLSFTALTPRPARSNRRP